MYMIFLPCVIAEVLADPPSYSPRAAARASAGVWAFLPLAALPGAGAVVQLIAACGGWHSSQKRTLAEGHCCSCCFFPRRSFPTKLWLSSP